MRDTKRVIAQFTFFDRTGIQRFLEKQAQKGWLLEKISPYGWKFRRIAPQKIHYAVTYFPEASMFDPEPSEKQQSFWELCEHTGWKLASHNAQMQIFYNERENPVPIETDPQTELETIEKSAKKSYLISYYILAVCGVLQFILALWRYAIDPLDFLSFNGNYFTLLCWIFLLVIPLMEVVGYYRWRKKARKAIEETEEFTDTKGYRNIQLVFMWIIIALFVVFLFTIEARLAKISIITTIFVFLMAAGVWGFSSLLKKFKVSTDANRVATIAVIIIMPFIMTSVLLGVIIRGAIDAGWFDKEAAYTYEYKGKEWKVYDDELPLMIEDLIDTDYDGYSTQWYGDESFAISMHDAYQRPRMDDLDQPDLQYTMVKVKLPFLYNFVHKQMLKDFPHNFGVTAEDYEFFETAVEIDPSEWGAKAAYQNYKGDIPQQEYLLCYNKCIIELRPDINMEITPQIKENVGRVFS